MIIEYEKCNFSKEQCNIEIKDLKNVFLKDTYFGIWVNNKQIFIVTIISYRTVTYKHYLNENLSTICDIQEYLKHNDSVVIIDRKEFEKQINHIKSIFEIGGKDGRFN